MSKAPMRAMRFIHTWLNGGPDLVESEVLLDRDGIAVPATVVMPARAKGPLPAWIALHGISRRGRAHGQLIRFSRALASTGTAVIVPEVPEWRDLDIAPGLTRPTILRSIQALNEMEQIDHSGYAVIGFSFGGPHALAASSDPVLHEQIVGAVSFGGYCDLHSTIRFMFTGIHEHEGVEHHNRPDPYGRWIVAANYLTSVPGYEDAGDVADAVRGLAALAGETGNTAWDPIYDPAKEEARARLSPDRVELFDLIAPHSSEEPDAQAGADLAQVLADAAPGIDPELDARPALADVTRPAHILHGRRDHLIPFSESYRLRDAFSESADTSGLVTRLFSHSAPDDIPSPLQMVREVPAFVSAMSRMLGVV